MSFFFAGKAGLIHKKARPLKLGTTGFLSLPAAAVARRVCLSVTSALFFFFFLLLLFPGERVSLWKKRRDFCGTMISHLLIEAAAATTFPPSYFSLSWPISYIHTHSLTPTGKVRLACLLACLHVMGCDHGKDEMSPGTCATL